ncbi:NADH-cytochrome b5 reductase-like [Acropora muricata]|uniref:NADH-cytochrome b5 reductase-like n=1 Tax=Acropora muricata TaxID=159855 RepID=UPI0034E40929
MADSNRCQWMVFKNNQLHDYLQKDRDCCGNGCTPCVFDIYEEEVCKWRNECERIKSGETLGDSFQSAEDKESRGFFDVLIKVYSNGKMSSYIRSWQVIGDMVEWRGPFGRFSYRPNKYKSTSILSRKPLSDWLRFPLSIIFSGEQ